MKTYKAKELAEIAGCGINTITRNLKRLQPGFDARKDQITENIAQDIMAKLPKRQMVSYNSPNGESARIDRLESMVEKLCGAVATLVSRPQNPLLIEHQDYYSILAYCNIKGIKPIFSEMQKWGKDAAKLSRESSVEIRRVPDERHGFVGSYHVSILEKVFEI